LESSKSSVSVDQLEYEVESCEERIRESQAGEEGPEADAELIREERELEKELRRLGVRRVQLTVRNEMIEEQL
jgi:hypothetical protein